MASTESPLNLIRGPAKKPGWAQLIRLGGDRVAILFGELRKSIGKIEGIIERLDYSAAEERWVVRYWAGGAGLFTVRISPGLLEASVSLNRVEIESLLGTRSLSGNLGDAIRTGTGNAGSGSITFRLKDWRTVRSFANLVKAKARCVSKTPGGNS